MFNNQSNPFTVAKGPQASQQQPVGIMQNTAAQHAQMQAQQPGVGQQMGNLLMARGANKGIDFAIENGGNLVGDAVGNLGTAAELGTTVGSEQTAMLAAQNAGIAEGAAGAANAGKGGAAAGAGAAGAGAAGTGIMAAAAPMVAPVLLGGLVLSKLFK